MPSGGLIRTHLPKVAPPVARFASQACQLPLSRPLRCVGGPPSHQPAAAEEVNSERTASADGDSAVQPPPPGAWKWEESTDARNAYGTLGLLLALGTTPAWIGLSYGAFPYFLGLAASTIYIGAHRGLTASQRQQISTEQGVLAPVVASASLFGLYLVIKFFPDLSIQTFLDVYFWTLGSFAVTGALAAPFRSSVGTLGVKSWTIAVPEGVLLDEAGESVLEVKLAPWDIISALAGVGVATAELAGGHTNFALSNAIACLVASDILQLLGVRSFRTAGALLAGLLLYDVFWVFASPAVVGDNVMMTVATSDVISGPTRLLFPKAPGGGGEAASFPFSLLGLGDIAVPGLLASLALRYDASRSTDFRTRAAESWAAIKGAVADMDEHTTDAEAATQTGDAAAAAFDAFADAEAAQRDGAVVGEAGGKPESTRRVPVSDAVLSQRTYFIPVMCAYVVGLGMAFAANEITRLGQPALLYLVPCTLLTVAGVAASRGELQRVWRYQDVPSYGAFEAVRAKEEAGGAVWPWSRKDLDA